MHIVISSLSLENLCPLLTFREDLRLSNDLSAKWLLVLEGQGRSVWLMCYVSVLDVCAERSEKMDDTDAVLVSAYLTDAGDRVVGPAIITVLLCSALHDYSSFHMSNKSINRYYFSWYLLQFVQKCSFLKKKCVYTVHNEYELILIFWVQRILFYTSASN